MSLSALVDWNVTTWLVCRAGLAWPGLDCSWWKVTSYDDLLSPQSVWHNLGLLAATATLSCTHCTHHCTHQSWAVQRRHTNHYWHCSDLTRNHRTVRDQPRHETGLGNVKTWHCSCHHCVFCFPSLNVTRYLELQTTHSSLLIINYIYQTASCIMDFFSVKPSHHSDTLHYFYRSCSRHGKIPRFLTTTSLLPSSLAEKTDDVLIQNISNCSGTAPCFQSYHSRVSLNLTPQTTGSESDFVILTSFQPLPS